MPPAHSNTSQEMQEDEESHQGEEETPYKIASLLLAKLGDFLVPGQQVGLNYILFFSYPENKYCLKIFGSAT